VLAVVVVVAIELGAVVERCDLGFQFGLHDRDREAERARDVSCGGDDS
jgi:hypothetical protein